MNFSTINPSQRRARAFTLVEILTAVAITTIIVFALVSMFNTSIKALQKTLLNVEGLGRQLYPDLDLWQTAKPYLERWMDRQIGPEAFFLRMEQEAPHWAQLLPKLPRLIGERLQAADDRQLGLEVELARTRDQIRSLRRIVLGLVVVLLLAVVVGVMLEV